MKKIHVFFFLFMGFSLSCKKPKPVTPTLPPITQEGKGTIGFMLGNEVWVPGDYVDPSNHTPGAEYIANINQLNIICNRRSSYSPLKIDVMGLHIKQANLTTGEYDLDQSNTILSFVYTQKDGRYRDYDFHTKGKLKISRIDLANKIVAGTFSFDATDSETREIVHVTQGRFDMKWQ